MKGKKTLIVNGKIDLEEVKMNGKATVCACYPAHCENAEHGPCWCSPRVEDHSDGRLIAPVPDGFTVGFAKILMSAIGTLTEAMKHLSACEPNINNWDYPAGMAEEVNDLLDAYYGVGVRPDAETIKKPNPIP